MKPGRCLECPVRNWPRAGCTSVALREWNEGLTCQQDFQGGPVAWSGPASEGPGGGTERGSEGFPLLARASGPGPCERTEKP